MANSSSKTWRIKELNLVKGAAKQRQAEDCTRANAWRKTREAKLEAVVNRSYDGREIPEMRALLDKASALMAPLIAEWNRLAAENYPAEFARPTLGISVTPGGFHPAVRDKIRHDAATHLNARHAYMLANSATFTTEILNDATQHATDNAEVQEFLERLKAPNRATPTLEPPGPAIGILRTLLPHPEEWGFDGYADGSPLLPAPNRAPPKALAAPEADE